MGMKEKLAGILGEPVRDHRGVGGGCIAKTGIVTMASGREYFVKSMSGSHDAMFLKEANGLRELEKANAIKVPHVVHAEADMLVLEVVCSGCKCADFMEVFGRQFAEMHRLKAEQFGFFEDNYIGATPQINTQCSSWTEFYWEHRLDYQFRLADSRGRGSSELRTLAGRLEGRIEDLLKGSEEEPCVLHGDLWGGNYMVADDGQPCLIDPAVYYGHREADLGMTQLFGGFNSSFYAAYNEAYPLPAGSDDRMGLYMLYHVLNHLNLFGTSYYSQAVSLLRKYV